MRQKALCAASLLFALSIGGQAIADSVAKIKVGVPDQKFCDELSFKIGELPEFKCNGSAVIDLKTTSFIAFHPATATYKLLKQETQIAVRNNPSTAEYQIDWQIPIEPSPPHFGNYRYLLQKTTLNEQTPIGVLQSQYFLAKEEFLRRQDEAKKEKRVIDALAIQIGYHYLRVVKLMAGREINLIWPKYEEIETIATALAERVNNYSDPVGSLGISREQFRIAIAHAKARTANIVTSEWERIAAIGTSSLSDCEERISALKRLIAFFDALGPGEKEQVARNFLTTNAPEQPIATARNKMSLTLKIFEDQKKNAHTTKSCKA